VTELYGNDLLVVAPSNELATRIADRRKELGIGQSEAARAADVSRPTWVKWEKGTTPFDKNWAVIERVLRWERGSIEAILRGGDPIVRRDEQHAPPPIPEGVLVDPADWAVMTADERATYVRIVTGVRRRRQQGSRGA